MRFGDLKDGESFVAAPDETDVEDGRGLYVFIKASRLVFGENAYRYHDRVSSHMPDSMPVLKVLL
jgi:hypothetical protein